MTPLFKRTTLAHALSISASLLVVAPSHAVSLSQDGLGQVLIYPYYTVRGGFDTYLSVLNQTDKAKAVKVRFRESMNGRNVLDFNLYLGAKDVWTAAITATPTGAKLITADKSCTSPAIPAGGKDFANFAFSGADAVPGFVQSGADRQTESLDRTREGYFEIIEMGTITSTAVAMAVTHLADVPANCAMVQAPSINMASDARANAVAPPSGGLAGTATLINVPAGTDYSYDPVVLSAFSNLNIWQPPGTGLPDLSSASPKTSVLIKDEAVIRSEWATGEDAVSALIMHFTLLNEFVLEPTTLSGTDWVVTMPTKHFYVPVWGDATLSIAPFVTEFGAGAWCEPAGRFQRWSREGKGLSFDSMFPTPPPVDTLSLCWESSVVTFNHSNVLASPHSENFSVNVDNGWTHLNFDWYARQMYSLNGDTYVGLPTIGFMVQDFVNGNVNGLLSNYGGSFRHKYASRINGKASLSLSY
ncbi:MAG: hypothetical protein V4805_21160 [Pseudomonadota bacterium]